MTFKKLSLLLIIFWIHCSSCEVILSDISNCSKIEASRDKIPSIWLTSENYQDGNFILKEAKVRRIANKARKFKLKCWAPFPITMVSTSVTKNENIIKKVENHFKQEKFEVFKMYFANSIFVVEPNKELNLEASCITTCDPDRFPHGVKIYTKDAGYFKKLFTEKVSSHSERSTRLNKRFLQLFIYLSWFFAWGVVILVLIRVSWGQRESQLENIQLDILHP